VAATPRIGTVFAGYRIEAVRGRGGMSVVYRAENPRLGNIVALKLLSAELAEDEGFRERFVRESRTAASIPHPHIIPIYDAGDAEGVLYIAMRYVGGPDLKELAKDRGRLPPARVLRLGAQVASALDAAHALALIHRDVKPANILLEAGADGEDHSYLADFGLTKHVDSHSGLTGSGQFIGTIDYMAPEQIEGRQVDARADVYALGCVLFECLAGSPPYRRDTEVAVLWAHMREEPPLLSSIRPDLPAEADDVLARALAKDPAERYESGGELVRELRAALGESSFSTARTVEGRAPRRRQPVGRLALAAVAGLALGAGIASAVLLATRGSSTGVEIRTRVETRTLTVPVQAVSLRTPSGNIGCRFTSGLTPSPSLRCDIRTGLRPRPRRPKGCNLNWGSGFSMASTGRSQVVCAGDTAIDPQAQGLRYSTKWTRGGFTCLSKTTGLRCANRDGHGFFLSLQRSYRF
jgi:serine/threonine protein kinase